VTNLQLHGNQIGNDGLEHFADALRTNKVDYGPIMNYYLFFFYT